MLRFRRLGNISSLRSFVLRVIVCCLRGVVSMSSSSRIPRFIVLFSSEHAGVSSWRRYGLKSSLRHFYVFVSSGLPFVDSATYLGKYLMYGDIYCTDLYLPFFAWYLITLLPCYSVTLLPCYPVTLSPCYLVTLLSCYSVTSLLCSLVTLLPCYPVSLFPWDRGNIL